MRRLAALAAEGPVSREQVALVAQGARVSDRTVWRWLAQVEQSASPGRAQFTLDAAIQERLVFWRGNVTAVHRELVDAAAAGGPPAPSLRTLQRAVHEALSPGEQAGLRRGERAARLHDVFLRRPATHRNAAWEADHVEASVEVDVEGRLIKPWVTWFVDCATNVVLGLAVTPCAPSRESVLAALRAAIAVDEPYGPAGGLPTLLRVDRGKDFLSTTVAAACAVFAVRVVDLPGYTPHLKGTVETLNAAVKSMFFAGLPRYTAAPRLANGRTADPDAPALRFEVFVDELLTWVGWWNTRHEMDVLDGRTPLQAWLDDPTPITTVPAEDLRLFTLEDDGRVRTITGKGVQWRTRFYIGAWMNGSANAGRQVRVRWMPHHDHEIEVFDARTGTHLGRAVLADQAGPEQVRAVQRARTARRDRLARELKAVEQTRRQRYAAATTPEPAQPLGTMTTSEASAELAAAGDTALRGQARPGLIPLGPPAPGWVLPRPLRPRATPAAEDQDESAGGGGA
ncbi:Mu transposase C-terminal domain-containing protein [Dactylosporangium sucinum]|uniref:transposase family protein n=1 Tax=Dactylosporangium sucinum TaxID=1424081 RepID=UPI001E50615D|nr:transposase family protein [Dactylosporangium sucinum]